MNTAHILYARSGHTVIIRLVGDIRYTVSASFKGFLDELFHDPAVQDIAIDLTATTNIDSTNLGLLAKIANHSRQHLHHKSMIASNNRDVNEVLHSVGFDRVFMMAENLDLPAEQLQEIHPEPAGRDELAGVLLDAHKTLMGMNEHNQDMFRDVVSALEGSSRGR